ncbi:hypothetical protein yc1106_04077 [Curvularia clavata]|uniref:DUF7918 domain-containing protein n=1 Tax=Curvularia clavata TaxID=95742 RepID=A0A9Q8ZAJ0_CURCL|nr:hypothetical protein yc1106_04077 [Curvularia clavata]
MAAIPGEPQLQVYVECNGQRLPEFDADENDANAATTTTKYIESKSGAEFAVQFELCRPFPQYAMRIRLYIDGKHISSNIVSEAQYQRIPMSAGMRRTFDNVKSTTADEQSIMQKFCFSELQIEDLDNHDLGAIFVEELKSMGTITLKAFYIQHLRKIPLKEEQVGKGECVKKGKRVEKSQDELGTIPEKALKGEALTHRTKLGPAINLFSTNSNHTGPTRTTYDYVHPRRLPFAIFDFKYRSIAALQSLLIIPRSPRLGPLRVRDENVRMHNITEPKREVSATTSVKKESRVKREHSAVAADDNDEVHRRLKEEPVLKREHSAAVESDEDGKDLVFVSETKRRQSNIAVNRNGVEVIDLT